MTSAHDPTMLAAGVRAHERLDLLEPAIRAGALTIREYAQAMLRDALAAHACGCPRTARRIALMAGWAIVVDELEGAPA